VAVRHRNAPKDLVARRKEIKAELRGVPATPTEAMTTAKSLLQRPEPTVAKPVKPSQ
jgi:hypothetical protein